MPAECRIALVDLGRGGVDLTVGASQFAVGLRHSVFQAEPGVLGRHHGLDLHEQHQIVERGGLWPARMDLSASYWIMPRYAADSPHVLPGAARTPQILPSEGAPKGSAPRVLVLDWRPVEVTMGYL